MNHYDQLKRELIEPKWMPDRIHPATGRESLDIGPFTVFIEPSTAEYRFTIAHQCIYYFGIMQNVYTIEQARKEAIRLFKQRLKDINRDLNKTQNLIDQYGL